MLTASPHNTVKEVAMNPLMRILSLLRFEFHQSRILRYRQQGRRLMRDSGISQQLLALNSRIDHHGCIMRQLEHELEAA